MTRKQALAYVSFVLDDSLGILSLDKMEPNARLVGWECGFEPLFVAVQSYIPGVRIESDDAEEIATDYLSEIGWFADGPTSCDYLL